MFIKIKEKNQVIDFSLAILLASLPLPVGFNNIALALFIISLIINYKELKFQLKLPHLLLIFYYILCIGSLLWSYETEKTIKYLSKGIFFIIIPLCFIFLPSFSKEKISKIIDLFSYLVCIESIIYLINAFIKYITTRDIQVFFYHELVTLEVNAIYVSLIASIAFLNLFTKRNKNKIDLLGSILLFIFIILLSSKNVILITLLCIILHLFKNLKTIKRKTLVYTLVLGSLLLVPISYKIFDRFKDEIKDTSENIILDNGIINVSHKNAWSQEVFDANHYFTGTSFRIYQARIFKEIMQEDNRLFNGYGAGAVQNKITEKQAEDGLFGYYLDLNFHNQYLQSFSTLGILGFIVLITMTLWNWISSLKQKDFIFFCFTILTTSLMFTESLFERQRGIIFFVLLYCLFHSTIKKRDLYK